LTFCSFFHLCDLASASYYKKSVIPLSPLCPVAPQIALLSLKQERRTLLVY
jgi:hypothetical protein